MNNTARPRRKKLDRLAGESMTQAEIQCSYAVAPLDRLAIEMDTKWGIDRLPELVSRETAEKYGSALGKLNAALEAAEPEQVALRVDVCLRGLRAMDAEAARDGRKVLDPEIWQVEYDGKIFSFIREVGDWRAVAARNPHLKFYTLREAAVALAFSDEARFKVEAVKEAFPGSTITEIRRRESLEDSIPF